MVSKVCDPPLFRILLFLLSNKLPLSRNPYCWLLIVAWLLSIIISQLLTHSKGPRWNCSFYLRWQLSLLGIFQDAKTFKSATRSLSDKSHGYSDDIAGLVKELQSVDAEGVSKVRCHMRSQHHECLYAVLGEYLAEEGLWHSWSSYTNVRQSWASCCRQDFQPVVC